MHYREWGDPAVKDVVVCVHGLTRNSRDFAVLAEALVARGKRVIAPDVIGRGGSEWLRNPMGYIVPHYVQDMLVLLARLNVDQVDWVGTSMGGLIGMGLAALPGNPVKRLLLNDVGPLLPLAAIARIAEYVGKAPPFKERAHAEAFIRAVSAPFGPHTDAEWADLADMMLMPDGQGGWRLNYDPGIAAPFAAAMAGGDIDLWPMYEAIQCPVHVLRGAESDLLTVATLEAMCSRGPKASATTFAGVGHAPTLRHADQVEAVVQFLV
ncbi:alpha/beta hydrolase [Burkholderiaceae bacterium DAT-1]|nr:alpha/beta hydrolase [Burkholderiaceae bacterium DAT-1]